MNANIARRRGDVQAEAEMIQHLPTISTGNIYPSIYQDINMFGSSKYKYIDEGIRRSINEPVHEPYPSYINFNTKGIRISLFGVDLMGGNRLNINPQGGEGFTAPPRGPPTEILLEQPEIEQPEIEGSLGLPEELEKLPEVEGENLLIGENLETISDLYENISRNVSTAMKNPEVLASVIQRAERDAKFYGITENVTEDNLIDIIAQIKINESIEDLMVKLEMSQGKLGLEGYIGQTKDMISRLKNALNKIEEKVEEKGEKEVEFTPEKFGSRNTFATELFDSIQGKEGIDLINDFFIEGYKYVRKSSVKPPYVGIIYNKGTFGVVGISEADSEYKDLTRADRLELENKNYVITKGGILFKQHVFDRNFTKVERVYGLIEDITRPYREKKAGRPPKSRLEASSSRE